jgi:protein-tyrosine phosphatase
LSTDHPHRFLNLAGIKNLRELGGYAMPTGVIRWNKLLRSGGLDQVPPQSQQALLEYGLAQVVDVRDEWEQQHYRNVFADVATVKYWNIPLIGDGHLKDANAQRIMEVGTLAEIYLLMLERCKPQIKRIFEVMGAATQQGCTVVHCYAGKDRTGLIVALLLDSLGVAPDLIVADYNLSDHLSAALQQKWQAEGEADAQRLERDAAAKSETMTHTLKYLQERYSGGTGYLRAIGVAEQTLMHLRANLLEPQT